MDRRSATSCHARHMCLAPNRRQWLLSQGEMPPQAVTQVPLTLVSMKTLEKLHQGQCFSSPAAGAAVLGELTRAPAPSCSPQRASAPGAPPRLRINPTRAGRLHLDLVELPQRDHLRRPPGRQVECVGRRGVPVVVHARRAAPVHRHLRSDICIPCSIIQDTRKTPEAGMRSCVRPG